MISVVIQAPDRLNKDQYEELNNLFNKSENVEVIIIPYEFKVIGLSENRGEASRELTNEEIYKIFDGEVNTND